MQHPHACAPRSTYERKAKFSVLDKGKGSATPLGQTADFVFEQRHPSTKTCVLVRQSLLYFKKIIKKMVCRVINLEQWAKIYDKPHISSESQK